MTSTTPGDITAARIRAAAIDLFGRQGFKGTTIRQIAEQSGVSQALVMHHFGDKKKLRHSCDKQVIDELFAHKAEVFGADQPTLERLVRDSLPESLHSRYLIRLLTEHGSVGDALWDTLSQETNAMFEDSANGMSVRDDPDEAARAQVMLAMSLSLIVFSPHIARGLGATTMNPGVLFRAHASMMRMLTLGAFDMDEETRALYEAYTANTAVANATDTDSEEEK